MSSTSSNTPPIEPDRLTTQLQVGRGRWPSFLLLAVLFAGFAAVALLFFTGRLVVRPAPNSPEAKTAALKDMATKNVEFSHLAESAANKVSWQSAQAKLLSSQSLQQKLLKANTKVNADLRQLAENADGKRIASNADWVDQIIAVQDRKRLSDDEVELKANATASLLAVCKAALEAELVLPCEGGFLDQVNAVHDELEKAVELCEADEAHIATLIRVSQSATPSNETLAKAIAVRKQAQSADAIAKLSEERKRQQEEFEKTSREQQLATERAIAKADLDRDKAEKAALIAEAESRAKAARLELARAEAEREKERLKRERVAKFEAALPGMKSLLSQFIATGRMHYVPGKGWREGDPGPLSFDAIKSTGGLNDDPVSLNTFISFCLNHPRENDRPLGSFPETTFRSEGSVAQIRREIQRAQTFLREYGDLLVERRMLQP